MDVSVSLNSHDCDLYVVNASDSNTDILITGDLTYPWTLNVGTQMLLMINTQKEKETSNGDGYGGPHGPPYLISYRHQAMSHRGQHYDTPT
jgi:hypothetical protein